LLARTVRVAVSQHYPKREARMFRVAVLDDYQQVALKLAD